MYFGIHNLKPGVVPSKKIKVPLPTGEIKTSLNLQLNVQG